MPEEDLTSLKQPDWNILEVFELVKRNNTPKYQVLVDVKYIF